jgi:ketosteroid isomerase-like protein
MLSGSPASLFRGASRLNVELTLRALAAVNSGRIPADMLAPEFWMENRASSVTDYTYWGTRGWGEWMSDISEEFTGRVRYSLEEIVHADEDLVIASFRVSGRSAWSGEQLDFSWAGVTWFRDGKALRSVAYSTRQAALRALDDAAARAA